MLPSSFAKLITWQSMHEKVYDVHQQAVTCHMTLRSFYSVSSLIRAQSSRFAFRQWLSILMSDPPIRSVAVNLAVRSLYQIRI